MKTSTKNEYKCQVELKVELNADEMKEIVKDVERAFVREARLPGFRPGKVPIEIIRKQFADGLKQETEHTMIRKHYQDAVKAEKLDEITLADVRRLYAENASLLSHFGFASSPKMPSSSVMQNTPKDAER